MKYLLEYNSFDNYDNYYYLVLRLTDETLQNLLSSELKGLKGISDNINIVNSYFDIRELMLVMDKKETERLNDLDKILYDDINYLCDNNFRVLKRLYQGENYPISSLLYQAKTRSDYFLDKTHKNPRINSLRRKVRYAVYSKIKFYDNISDNVENYDVLLKEFDTVRGSDIDITLRYIILNFASLFEKEGEILVNKDFIIPDKSVLFIKEQNPDSFTHDKYNDLMDKYLEQLKAKFLCKILPYKHGHIISNTHKPIFAYIRYLDKMKHHK